MSGGHGNLPYEIRGKPGSRQHSFAAEDAWRVWKPAPINEIWLECISIANAKYQEQVFGLLSKAEGWQSQ